MFLVSFTARLATEPDLKTTTSGTPICTFNIVSNRPFKGELGEPAADFMKCVAWRQTGEFVAANFTKGKMITGYGRLQNREWTDKTGVKRTITEIIVERVEFCDSKKPDRRDDYEVIESEEDLPF